MPAKREAKNKQTPQPSSRSTLVQASKFLPPVALRSVTSRDGLGVYASSDTLYKGAVFGRDSLEVCEDLLSIRPALVRRSLLTLASLQGENFNPISEEEPGKIVHEYRRRVVDGKPITGKQRDIFETLSKKWGGTSEEMIYFGSVDATPHFIRTVGAYCEAHPRQAQHFLKQLVTLRSGTIVSLHEVVERATGWLLRHIENSQSGFVEYQRLNPEGIENQVWKDSDEFYVHENGQLANHAAPISSIEVQGLAYDALWVAAILFPDSATSYLAAAATLRQKVFDRLWQPDRRYFALGTDFTTSGALRIITTKAANPAALLDTRLFDDLPPAVREPYVSALVAGIMSDDFLTNAGVRSRALSERQLIKFKDYHGSYVSWPRETYDIAKGLRRQGFVELAKELENRLLNVCLRNLAYPEFLYIDGQGRVLPARPTEHKHGGVIIINGVNKPEVIQAWTVSAVLAIIAQRAKAKARPAQLAKRALAQAKSKVGHTTLSLADHDHWQTALEQNLLATIPRVNRLMSPAALRARYPRYDFQIKR